MQVRQFTKFLVALAGYAWLAPSVYAQTSAGAGTVVVIPLISSIPGAYTSEVFVRNLNQAAITLKVRYYSSNSAAGGAAASKVCTDLVVPATSGTSNGTTSFDLATQCGLGTSDDFGMVFLEDITGGAGVPKTKVFTAYSRTQMSNGIGFSVEGFPIGNFSAATADAIGLKNTTTSPSYRTNCFVGSLGESVTYQIALRDSSGNLIGSPISGTIGPYQTIRYLDVFATALGLPPPQTAGNYSNVRATFDNVGDPQAGQDPSTAFIGYCTVESSLGGNGSADFRIAKSVDADDQRQSRLVCYGQGSCGAPSGVDQSTANAGTRNIHYSIFEQPDFVRCSVVVKLPDDANKLDIMVRGPDSTPTSNTPYTLTAPYHLAPFTAGGVGAKSFYIYTGERSTTSGFSTRWYIDVQLASGATGPVVYGITCTSGNGVTIPWLGQTSTTLF